MAKLVLPRVQAMVVCDAIKESEEEADVFHLHGVRNVLEVFVSGVAASSHRPSAP